MQYFSYDEIVSKTAIYTLVNGNIINKIFNEIRQHLFLYNLKSFNKEDGEFELDESYFGAKRVKGKKGRGAAGKTPVFGLLKRDDKAYVQILQRRINTYYLR